jgi:hypothetical protein
MKKNIPNLCLLLILFYPFSTIAQPSGYSYGKKITIDYTKVSGSSSLTDFPVLLSFTDNDLRTTSNSGYVQSSNGYDIIFTNGNGTTTYSHEIEKYNSTTGEFIAWVKVPSLSATSDTEINMYYGNSSISSNPSSSSTWNSDYIMNMHMDDISTSSIGNSSAQTFTGYSVGSMTSSDIVTGKIGSGLDFDGSNDGIKLDDNNTIDLNTNDFSFSCWFKTDAIGNSQTLFNKKTSGGGVTGFGAVRISTSGTLGFYFKGNLTSQGGGTTTATVSANTWYNFHITCDVLNDEVKIYLNGTLVTTTTVAAGATLANSHDQYFGSFSTGSSVFDGVLDEMRVSLTNLSSDWIATEYTNQNSPSNFYSVSTHQSATSGLPAELIHFTAQAAAHTTAELNWATASETDNSHFVIERSYDARSFIAIDRVAGNGNSSEVLHYAYTDMSIAKGTQVAFYRLHQFDYNGVSEYSDVRRVTFGIDNLDEQSIAIYPNPFTYDVYINFSTLSGGQATITVTNINGQQLLKRSINNTEEIEKVDLSSLSKGIYFVKVTSDIGTTIVKVIKR